MKRKLLIIYILVLLINISVIFVNIPSSNSKFLEEVNRYISYYGKLNTDIKSTQGDVTYKLYANGTIDINLEFLRNSNLIGDITNTLTDTYYVTYELKQNISNACILKINDFEVDSIIFTNDVQTNTKVTLTCNQKNLLDSVINDSIDDSYLFALITVNESIKGDTNFQFSYKKFVFNLPYKEYLEELSKLDSLKNTIIVPKFTTPSVTKSYYSNKLNSYLTSFYKDTLPENIHTTELQYYGNKAFTGNTPTPINGLDVTDDIVNSWYLFNVGTNFEGYARTVYMREVRDENDLYFSKNLSDEDVTNIFNIYLDQYYVEKKDSIKNYVERYSYNSNGEIIKGIPILVNYDKLIPGIQYDKENYKLTILDNIDNYINDITKYATQNHLATGMYLKSLSLIKSLGVFININPTSSTGGFTTIPNIRTSLEKNQNVITPISFVDVFIVWDSGLQKYVLFRNYSNAGTIPEHAYNTLELTTFTVEGATGGEITIDDNTSDENNIYINISNTLDSDIKNDIIARLNVYFGSNLVLEDGSTTKYKVSKIIPADYDS